jgi:hypothetical protein
MKSNWQVAIAALVFGGLSGCASIEVSQPRVPPRAAGSWGGMSGTPITSAYNASTLQQKHKMAFAIGKFEPSLSDDVPAADGGDYVGREAGHGARQGVRACGSFFIAGPFVGGLLAMACAPIGATMGAVGGGASAAGDVSEANARATRSRLQAVDPRIQFPTLLGTEIGSYVGSRGFQLPELANEGPTSPEELTVYGGSDRVVEAVVSRVHVFVTDQGRPYRVEVWTRGRLMRADGWVLDVLSRKDVIDLPEASEEAWRESRRAMRTVAQAYVDKWVVARADTRGRQ